MSKGPGIIAFTKDWDDVPTCTTHILREMGKTMPVLWVSSIGTRKPRFTNSAHIDRVLQRVAVGLRRAELKENELRVLSPLLIPKAQSGFARAVNRCAFGRYLRRELDWMGTGPLEYWCFVPNAVDLLPRDPAPEHSARCRAGTRRPKAVYYCADDWSKFRYLDTRWMMRKEDALLMRADVIFAASQYLADKLRRVGGDKVHYVPHGVEHAKFAAALSESTVVPEEIRDLPKPVIGFYGNIYPWIDFDLLESIALRRPDWSFIMIGGIFCDISRFTEIPNVRFIGRREHDALPSCCKGFDAAIIPYDMKNPRMQSVSPVKTRELLAAGVPVVASDVPEVRQFGSEVLIGKSVDEWVMALEKQITREDRRAVSESVADDDWSGRVKSIRLIVERTCF